MRTIVESARHEQDDGYNGKRNFPEYPALSRRRARACHRTAPALGVPLQPLQVGSHLRCALITQVAVFLQSLINDVFQLGRQIGIQSHGRNRCSIRFHRRASSADKVKLLSPHDRFVIALHSPDRVVETGLLVCPPEKKAAKLASSNEQDTFSGPL